MPPNIYGERDHFDDVGGSHVMAALIHRIVHAKLAGDTEITIWGTGAPRREFMHTDDLADALLFLANNYSDEAPINVGWGQDIPIDELASLIAESVGWEGMIKTDPSKPDGTMQKVMDVSRITALGWTPKIGLVDGVRRVAQDYERKLRNAYGTGLWS
jgi:GDP-L-fucose synthase